MKNNLTLIIVLVCTICQAQSPLRINFQGVIRNSSGDLIVSESLVLEIGLKASLSSPGFVYRESHNIQTNAYGQVSVQIGNGTVLNGAFNAVDWSTGTVTFEAVATISGTNLIVSQQQLSSVPYALFATKAQSLSGPDDIDNTNEIQSLNLTGNILGISGHAGTVNLSSLLDNTDNQTLSFINNNLSISGGNNVNLSSLINDADADPANELQTLNFSNTTLGISGGNSVNLTTLLNDADADPVNEIQHLSVSGSTLQLSQSANTINLGPYLGVNTDEQTLSLSGTSLSITNGNAVDLAPFVQDLQLNSNILSLTSDPTTIDLTPYLQNAGQVSYSNASSGLSATTVQAAIDEVVVDKPDNLQEAYSGGAVIQLNGADEFRIRNSTAGSILSTSNAIGGIGVGIETPQHKIHVEGSTLLTTHPGFDALEDLITSSYETGELHYFTEGEAANHVNVGVTNIMNGTGTNLANLGMAQSNTATQNYGSYGFATGGSSLNAGVRARTLGTNATSTNYGILSTVTGDGNFNHGVNATSTGASIENIGLRAAASGTATTSYGIVGLTNSTGTTNYGVHGIANGAGTTNYGIYGTASGATTNYAGYFNGNVTIAAGALEVTTISSSGSIVNINDNLNITGNISSGGNLSIPSASNLEVTNLASSGAIVNINDNLSITGNISSSGSLSVQGPLTKGTAQIIDIRNESVYAGESAGLANTGTTFRNVGVGYGTLQYHTTGPDNVAIGAYALNSNTTSTGNVAVGSFAADGITTLSNNNVAIGISTLSSITTNASYNTALGRSSMENITSGNENVAIGYNTMNSNNSAGSQNVAVGTAALNNINGGGTNVILGHGAGGNIDIESSNVLLGAYSNTTGNVYNGVAIGFEATVAQNDAIILGSTTNGNVRVGIGTNAPAEKLHVVGNATISGVMTAVTVTETSDERLKENIEPLNINKVLEALDAINTYQYTWKADSASTAKRIQYGVIAQEVERILPNIVHTDAKGFKSVNYTALIPFLLEAIKSQQQKIEELQKSNDGLQSLLEKELSILTAEVKLLKNEKAINAESHENK